MWITWATFSKAWVVHNIPINPQLFLALSTVSSLSNWSTSDKLGIGSWTVKGLEALLLQVTWWLACYTWEVRGPAREAGFVDWSKTFVTTTSFVATISRSCRERMILKCFKLEKQLLLMPFTIFLRNYNQQILLWPQGLLLITTSLPARPHVQVCEVYC